MLLSIRLLPQKRALDVIIFTKNFNVGEVIATRNHIQFRMKKVSIWYHSLGSSRAYSHSIHIFDHFSEPMVIENNFLSMVDKNLVSFNNKSITSALLRRASTWPSFYILRPHFKIPDRNEYNFHIQLCSHGDVLRKFHRSEGKYDEFELQRLLLATYVSICHRCDNILTQSCKHPQRESSHLLPSTFELRFSTRDIRLWLWKRELNHRQRWNSSLDIDIRVTQFIIF